RLGLVGLAIRFEQGFQHVLGILFLIGRQLGDRYARDLAFFPFEFDAALVRRNLDQRLLTLLSRKHLKQLIGLLGLMPEDISGVPDLFIEARSRVSIEARATEG